jgi:large subunit ribosomal protein L15
MLQEKLSPASGSKRDKKRVGRGDGSGKGTYSGRGSKGQKARAGFKMRPGFEGGQLPLIKRLPRKRGFTSHFKTDYCLVSLAQLGVFEPDSEVTAEKLLAAGLIKSLKHPIKVLAGGELKCALVVKANKFSAAAKAKIEAAGGKAEEVV